MLRFSARARDRLPFVLVGLVVALAGMPLLALDRDRTIAQLQHTAWTVKDGAPPDVWALAQAPDGYLWLGTGAGLYRFDGVRFERFQPRSGQFNSNNMTALTALPSGELWIGYYFGGASVLKDEHVTNFGEREGMPPGAVYRFARDLDGGLWAATAEGLARFDGNRWRTVGSEWAYPAKRAKWVFVDRDGTLWVATHETLVFLRRGARRFEPTGERVVGNAVIAQAQDGTLWISDDLLGTRALRTGANSHADTSRDRTRAKPIYSKRMLFDRDGNLWATDGGRGGLNRIAFPERLNGVPHLSNHDLADVFTLEDGLTSNIAVPLLEDAEGNLWVGTNLGLNRFRRNNVIVETRIQATSSAGFVLATDNRGEVLVANPGALFKTAQNSAHVLVPSVPELSSAYRDVHGTLWFGGPGTLLRLEGQRLVRTFLPQDFAGSDVQAIAGERSGALWLSVKGKGVYRYADEKWQLWGDRADLPRVAANTVTNDAQGRIWLGYPDSLVAVLEGNRVRTYSARDGLNVGHVMAVQQGAKGLWIAGELGIARVQDGRVRTLSTKQVDVFCGLSGIVETAEGELWLNGILGIVRVTLAEMEQAFADPNRRPRYQLFDFRDGLPGVAQQASPVPTAVAAADGKLWFATNHGVVYIDPQRVVKNSIPPPVAIRSLTANGQRHAPTASLQLPKLTSSVHIEYTALSLSVPERVRFLHQLEGAETQWQDAGARREAS
jgi:ligand-binding sensor domain-containing protein